jgi:hypothetical protein
MPDRMPEDLPGRTPEDMPVTKCINVMVGITRSKVFFSLNQSIDKNAFAWFLKGSKTDWFLFFL